MQVTSEISTNSRSRILFTTFIATDAAGLNGPAAAMAGAVAAGASPVVAGRPCPSGAATVQAGMVVAGNCTGTAVGCCPAGAAGTPAGHGGFVVGGVAVIAGTAGFHSRRVLTAGPVGALSGMGGATIAVETGACADAAAASISSPPCGPVGFGMNVGIANSVDDGRPAVGGESMRARHGANCAEACAPGLGDTWGGGGAGAPRCQCRAGWGVALESGMTRWSCVTVVGGRVRPDGECPVCRSRGTTVGRSCETVVGWPSTTRMWWGSGETLCGWGQARLCAVGSGEVRVRRDPVRCGSGETL